MAMRSFIPAGSPGHRDFSLCKAVLLVLLIGLGHLAANVEHTDMDMDDTAEEVVQLETASV